MSAWSLRARVGLAYLAALLTLPFSAATARGQGQTALDSAAAAAAEKEIRQLVTSFYEAYAREDLPGLVALWHPKGPGRSARNIVEVEFELKDSTLRSLIVRDVRVDAGGGRARVMVELGVTDRRNKRTRTDRRVREMTFLRDEEGTWKVWNDATSGMSLAKRLLSAPAAERKALLEAEPELASDDTWTGLGMEIGRLRVQGGMLATLDAISAREMVARALSNEGGVASCLLDAGLIFQVLGQLAEATKAFAEAREIFVRVGTPLDVANLDANLAAVDYLGGDYASALTRFQQALVAYEEAGDQARVASLLHGIGNTFYMQGQFERALEFYGRAQTITSAAGNKVGASTALQAIALVHKELGNYTQAGEAYAASAVLAAEAGDHNAAARAFHGQGEVHRLEGDHALALEAYHRALDAWTRLMDPPNRASTMFAIGQVHAAERSFISAVEWYQKALDVDSAAKERGGIARDTGGLAGAHFAMGQVEAALTEYQKSLELREELKDLPGVTWTLLHMGVLHVSQNRLQEALNVYTRAIGLAERLGDQPALGVGHALKGSAELAGGAPGPALESVARALEFAGRTEQFDAVAFARTVEGKVHRDAGRADEARAAFEQAIAAVTKVPVGPASDSFFTDRWGPYLALADLLVKQGHAAAALDCLERGRQHALSTLLGGDGVFVTKGLTDTEREEEQALVRGVRSATVRLKRERARTAPDPERETALRDELAKAAARRDELRAKFFAVHPDLRVLRAQADPVPAATLLPALVRPAEAVLTFAVTEKATHVLIARLAGGAVTVRAATVDVTANDLAGRVARWREALLQRDAEADVLSSDLYSLLLVPIESHLAGATRIIVVPDAMLWGLPFEALRTTSRRYLVERAAVSYVPSLSALAAAEKVALAAKPSRRVLAVGAPVISKAAEERVALFRPGYKPGAAGGTEREVRAVASLAGPGGSHALLGNKATAGNFAGAVTAGTIAHLAAPVVLSDASPLRSLLVLSPAGDQDTGLAEVGALLGWELPAAAAVLPTAQGWPAGPSADALAGLSWSLLVAGTPAVVVSRWPLAARPPARVDPLVAGFYRARLAPATAAVPAVTFSTALQRAAKRLIVAPATRHPGDWAGLMVIGR